MTARRPASLAAADGFRGDVAEVTLGGLIADSRAVIVPGRRSFLGITAPGSGKVDRRRRADGRAGTGYVHLLRRLHARDEPIVYSPFFDRRLEESIGSAIPVPSTVPLVITEGNYLLLGGPHWRSSVTESHPSTPH